MRCTSLDAVTVGGKGNSVALPPSLIITITRQQTQDGERSDRVLWQGDWTGRDLSRLTIGWSIIEPLLSVTCSEAGG
jgi:hypothetical protein